MQNHSDSPEYTSSPSVFHFPALRPWPESVDGALLLNDLVRVLSTFVVLPRWAAQALALWVLHTYAFNLRDTSAYIGIESPEKRCGKTTLLAVLSELVNRPVVAANITSPAWFRVIQELQPTLLIDEADTFLKGNSALRGILNSGSKKRTAFVVRVGRTVKPLETNGANAAASTGPSLASFSSWCPKALATIGRFPDTVGDRCILIRMQRKTAQEQSQRLNHLDATDLRRQCLRFVNDHAGAIPAATPQIPVDLNDRAADIWEPLLVLADLAEGDWPACARQAALGLTAAAQEQSPIGTLFLDLLMLFTTNRIDRIFSRTLAAYLNTMPDRPWVELRKGNAINERWLASVFRPYRIFPRTIWIGDDHAKGYFQEDFLDAFRRYIPKSEFEALKTELMTPRPSPTPTPAPAPGLPPSPSHPPLPSTNTPIHQSTNPLIGHSQTS